MQKKDLAATVLAAALIAVFLPPTLRNLGLYNKIPNPNVVIYAVFPILAIVGTIVANFLGRRMAILWQIAKFGLVGVLNTTIDFGILNFLIILTGISSGSMIIALNLASFGAATVNSYFWNKYWVFAGTKRGNFVTFMIVSIVGIAINTATVYLLTNYVPPQVVESPVLWANIAKVLATGLSLVWNFLGYKLIVFKK